MPYVDTIKISSGQISNASINNNDVILTVGSGSLTIKNSKGKDLNITDQNGNTRTYAFTSTVTNPTSNFEERWFLDNENFGIQDNELDSIMYNNANTISIDYKFNDVDNEENILKLNNKNISFNQNKD